MLVHHLIEHHGEGCCDGSVGGLSATDLRDGTSEDGVSSLVRCFKDRNGLSVCKDIIYFLNFTITLADFFIIAACIVLCLRECTTE